MNYDVKTKDNDAVMLLMDGARALADKENSKFREARDDESSCEETLNWHEYRYLKAKAMVASLNYTFAKNRAVDAKIYTPDTPVGRADLAVYAADRDKAKAEYTFAVLVAETAENAWRESYKK